MAEVVDGVRAGSGNIHGVTLQVEAAGDRPAESFTFYKSVTRAVTIGRKSKQARPPSFTPLVTHNALFLCPVVSRKHAKITLTEYGNAYITDLRSHHGTHLIRPGEKIPKKLEPETATVLADGDVLIFGKAVGRDKDIVEPVTAHVKLLFTPTTDNPTATPPLERISLSPDTTPSEKSPAPGTSGRYGIYVSSDSSASSSDGDSDIEEIPPPFSFPLRMRTTLSQASQSSQPPPISARMQILRNLLPAVPSSCVDEPPPTAFAQLLASSSLPAPGLADADSSSESSSSSLEYADEPAQVRPHFDDWHGLYASPNSRPQAEVLTAPDIPAIDSVASHAMAIAELFEESFPCEFDAHEDRPISPPPPLARAGSSTTSFSVLEDRVQTAREDISLLRQLRSADEQRFEAQIREVKERLAALDEAIHAPAPASERDATLMDVIGRMDILQGQMSALERCAAGPSEATMAESLKDIKALIQDVKDMRANGLRQLASELEALKVARAQAEAMASETVARLESIRPLKRKRSVEDEDEMDEGEERVVAPMPKRRRTAHLVAKMLVRTATVATVGAVAAWTALAFA